MTTVTMPNGMRVEGVPEGTTQAVLIDDLIRQGRITTAQATEWTQGVPEGTLEKTEEPVVDHTPVADSLVGRLPASMTTGAGAQNPDTFSSESLSGVVDAVTGNIDIPAGIAGSIAGAQAGSVAGPYGAAVGGVIGGAVGTFGGSLMSDYLTEDTMDMSAATQEALISAGFDTATLGAARAFKPVARAMGFGPDEMAALWNKYTKAAPVTDPKALPVGSPESRLQTQNFLESKKGSLTAYQTGQSTATQDVMEGIGQMGVLSGRYYDDLNARNSKAIADEINRLVDGSVGSVAPGNIGESIHGIIQGGKKAAQLSYNSGLDEIITRVGRKQVQPQWIAGTVNKFLKDHKKEWGYDLDPAALKVAQQWQEVMKELPSMSVSDLLAFQKRMNTQVSQLGDFGATQNSVASRELADLSSRIRKTTGLLLENADPESYKVYKELNSAYGDAMKGLLPKLNANVVSRADKGDYESIARALEGKNPDQIEAFMASIDSAYQQAGMAGLDMGKEARFATPEQAKAAIKSGWLKNIFGESLEEGYNPSTFASKADYYEKPANARSARAVLGEDFATFKMLLNALNESSQKQKGFVGSLVLRSKEAAAASNVAQGVVGLGAGAAALPVGAAVFLTPVMLAHIASNKNAVRALLAGNKRASMAQAAGKTAAVNDIMLQTIEQVMGLMSEEQQADIRNNMR
jgi:hypothetical protein